ncbi:MAG: hypothetical protein FJY85_10400 [Deltaproteobacteria bacterium]|nr:hypothetical protein [Deltaproteobacteria bacterium]
MRILAERGMTVAHLTFDQRLEDSPTRLACQLRGAMGTLFPDQPMFHQHDQAGGVLYKYPMIQYRWGQGRGIVVGWEEAAPVLRNLGWLDLLFNLDNKVLQVTEVMLCDQKARFGISDRLLRYALRTPALLFNQRNYRRYKELSAKERQVEKDRLLVAQMLISLRGMNVEFPERLYAAFVSPRSIPCTFKGQTLLAVQGQFVTNAVLPEGFALGHAVSHGYGWIIPISDTDTEGP